MKHYIPLAFLIATLAAIAAIDPSMPPLKNQSRIATAAAK